MALVAPLGNSGGDRKSESSIKHRRGGPIVTPPRGAGYGFLGRMGPNRRIFFTLVVSDCGLCHIVAFDLCIPLRRRDVIGIFVVPGDVRVSHSTIRGRSHPTPQAC